MRKVKSKDMWPYNEVSTRNCIHAKVHLLHGKEIVKCKFGKPLRERPRVATGDGMSLAVILKSPHFVSGTCKRCLQFEHDLREG